MEIKAYSVYDLKATKDAWRAGIYNQKNPAKSFWRYIILASLVVAASVLYQFLVKQVILMWVLSGLLVFFSVLLSAMYFIVPILIHKDSKTLSENAKGFCF